MKTLQMASDRMANSDAAQVAFWLAQEADRYAESAARLRRIGARNVARHLAAEARTLRNRALRLLDNTVTP